MIDLRPNPRSGKFGWAAFLAGVAGVVFFGTLPERYTDFDWRIPSLLVGVPFWFSFDQQLVGLPHPLFRMTTLRVWIGRVILLGGFAQLTLARRTLEDFVAAFLVLLSIYLVVWAAVGPQHLFTALGWRLITSPRHWGVNVSALLSRRPLPIRKPALTNHQWMSELHTICSEIDRWQDPFALRFAVMDTLQSHECLALCRGRLDPELGRAASDFLRSLDTRHVSEAALEFVRVYRRNRRPKPPRCPTPPQ